MGPPPPPPRAAPGLNDYALGGHLIITVRVVIAQTVKKVQDRCGRIGFQAENRLVYHRQ